MTTARPGQGSAGQGRAALFDWDGTLVDSRRALLSAWHEATSAVLGRRFPIGADEERAAFARRGREVFARLADGDAARVDALVDRFQRAYDTGPVVTAFPGTSDVLTAVRAAGWSVAVVTSKARVRYAADVAATGLGGLVDVAVCAEDVEHGKPHPDPVLRACALLEVPPARAVLVGDTVSDVAAAGAAGVGCIGVGWGTTTAAELIAAGARATAATPAGLTSLILETSDEWVP